jgi:hypothetical protein
MSSKVAESHAGHVEFQEQGTRYRATVRCYRRVGQDGWSFGWSLSVPATCDPAEWQIVTSGGDSEATYADQGSAGNAGLREAGPKAKDRNRPTMYVHHSAHEYEPGDVISPQDVKGWDCGWGVHDNRDAMRAICLWVVCDEHPLKWHASCPYRYQIKPKDLKAKKLVTFDAFQPDKVADGQAGFAKYGGEIAYYLDQIAHFTIERHGMFSGGSNGI